MSRQFLTFGNRTLRAMFSSSTNLKLQGKVAVVTASTDGIGYAVAKRLGAEGANVVVSSRKAKNVEAAVKKLKDCGYNVTGTVCHVAKADDREKLLKEAIDKFGGIDILVSNAAANPAVGPVLDCPEEVWDKIFEVNVKSAFMLSKEVLPHLKKRGKGSIIYISSIAGYQPLDLLGAYSVSKTALLGLTKAAALDLACDNIRVNCVAPGIVQTKFSSNLYENETAREITLSVIPMRRDTERVFMQLAMNPDFKHVLCLYNIISTTTLTKRRLAQPDDIAGVVAFLCSDDASYITGETIIVSGGMQSRL